MTNVLILSAGRRVELINCFKNARDRLGIKGNIIAADCSELAPALYFADINEIVPRISEGDKYIEAIINICVNLDVALVVPTIDTELQLLSENREKIESMTNAKVLISSEEAIGICRNKKNTQAFMEKHGFLVPRMLSDEEMDKGELSFPLFIKPLDGSSSINAFKVNNAEELETYRKLISKPIVQEFMEGTEYTVDVFLDFESRIITEVPRVRLATRSGEIAKGTIVKDHEIMRDVARLMQILRPIGHITVQCMKTKRGIEYIEINPRFGGGAPMSIMAGADSCENLYRLLNGEKLEYNENYREKLTFLRFDQSIMLNENMEREYEYEGSYF
ncbi:carbamoyl-phosphate synthase large subunit [Lachnospiraceae bacterium KH1T2]|nr:carbamoyl-phosphate synthase large subunit [Lachnospiraceae bacterium KH1T2]